MTGFAVCAHCGSPLVGSCLRGNYRYYICRGTYPTASRKSICKAHYIKADWLENSVWGKAKSVLKNPELLLKEVSKQLENEKEQISTETLDQEIRLLKRKLKGYEGQERRLMGALRLNIGTPDIVLDEINQMNKEKEVDKIKLASLLLTIENLAKMSEYENKLKELCARIAPDIENCTNQDKKDAYTYLDLAIKATPEGVDIKGYLDPSVLTIGQTWASPHEHSYHCPPV